MTSARSLLLLLAGPAIALSMTGSVVNGFQNAGTNAVRSLPTWHPIGVVKQNAETVVRRRSDTSLSVFGKKAKKVEPAPAPEKKKKTGLSFFQKKSNSVESAAVPKKKSSVATKKKVNTKKSVIAKKKTNVKKEPEKEKRKDDYMYASFKKNPNLPPLSQLIGAFMNPMRNPNSIFVYMIIIINVLGKLNEDLVVPK